MFKEEQHLLLFFCTLDGLIVNLKTYRLLAIAYIYTFASVYKTLINILLLVVLATQMFPVEQVGKILYSNQITEELPHNTDTEVVKKSQGYSEFLVTSAAQICNSIFQSNSIRVYDCNINFPSNHSKDIHNPPPNFRYLL